MTQSITTRRFRVHARHVDRHEARVLMEPTFEAAAIAYVEDFPLAFDGGGDVSIIVHDIDTGREHCFRVDFATGEAAPCG